MDRPEETVDAIEQVRDEVEALRERTASLLSELDRRVRPTVDGVKRVAAITGRVRAGLARHPGYLALGAAGCFAIGLLAGLAAKGER